MNVLDRDSNPLGINYSTPRHISPWLVMFGVGLWFRHSANRCAALEAQWQEYWRIQTPAVIAHHNELLWERVNQYLALGYCDEYAAEHAVEDMNNHPRVQLEREYCHLGAFVVTPEWKAQMAAKRQAEAPPPYKSVNDIKRLLNAGPARQLPPPPPLPTTAD